MVNLDSVAQRESFDTDSNTLDDLPGVLRVGCLLTGHLLLTDAQVLDGVLLMKLGPKRMTDCIGSSFSIVARAATLEESLQKFFDPGDERLRRVELSSLIDCSTEKRIDIGRRISEIPAERFRLACTSDGVVNACAALLHDVGAPDSSVTFMKNAWTEWIDADRQSRLEIHDAPYGKLDMVSQAERKPLERCLNSPQGAKASKAILDAVSQSKTRSEIRAVIESFDLSIDDKNCAREWLDAVYVCSIARHYSSMAIELPRSSARRLAQRRSADESKLVLNVESVKRLADVRIATFEVIFDKTRDDARAWRLNRKDRHIRHLAAIVERDTTPDSLERRGRLWSALRIAFVATVIQLVADREIDTFWKFALPVLAALVPLAPLFYRTVFPRGELTAMVDPIE